MDASERHARIIKKVEALKERCIFHEAYLKRFVNDFHESALFWAYVDLLIIADISILLILYSISE